jgi:hypothetical protein
MGRLMAVAAVAAGLWACGPVQQQPVDVCANVPCTNGRCVVDRGSAACLCNDGFAPDGLSCVAHTVDPCSPNPCAGSSKSACSVHNGAALCSCPAHTVDVAGSCLNATPCSPNPCRASNQSTCVVDAGALVR